MLIAVRFAFGKLRGPSLLAANDLRPERQISRRVCLCDRKSQVSYLIDTGSDVSAFPRSLLCNPNRKRIAYQLAAENNTTIATYGTMAMVVDLGLRRDLSWNFFIADDTQPIIGVGFLSYYSLIADVKNRQITDAMTGTAQADIAAESIATIKVVTGSTAHHKLLEKFPGLTRPDGAVRLRKHATQPHIETSPGPSVVQKPRRLAPDRLLVARKELEAMLKLETARPSKSCWLPRYIWVQKGVMSGVHVAIIEV
ncbi:uncharacterized protein LOC113374477 [Ctenocephalides felis]|uniref:uncharacterized protein LOC113374477 n=1 Tax=Ctenocephalides felis TaxID=7515 RepID=UPI000E6E5709|nr:uncharacterized protein LOC113374477 [Ctenocephalides felis]